MNDPLTTSTRVQATSRPAEASAAGRAAAVTALLFLFLVGVNGLGAGFEALGREALGSFFAATANPFVGLMIGVLATTLVQSSSVTTSIIVGLVAAPVDPLPIAHAVPMVMGANIGTTVTNTLAALAHVGRRDEFRRAFAVATVHDFFNYVGVLVLLPLELTTGFLQRSAVVLARVLRDAGGARLESPLKGWIHAVGVPIEEALSTLLGTGTVGAIAHLVVSGLLIFLTLLAIVRVLRASMLHRLGPLLERALGSSAAVGVGAGLVATMAVQSSSITTSLLVPFAGAGVLTLAQAFPVTIGANIGTTITALLAALAATGEHASAALVVALVHLLFNVSSALVIYPFAPMRRLPLSLASGLASVAARSRAWAIAYVLGLFYLVPLAFALLAGMLRS